MLFLMMFRLQCFEWILYRALTALSLTGPTKPPTGLPSPSPRPTGSISAQLLPWQCCRSTGLLLCHRTAQQQDLFRWTLTCCLTSQFDLRSAPSLCACLITGTCPSLHIITGPDSDLLQIKSYQLEQTAQDCEQMGVEYLQG